MAAMDPCLTWQLTCHTLFSDMDPICQLPISPRKRMLGHTYADVLERPSKFPNVRGSPGRKGGDCLGVCICPGNSCTDLFIRYGVELLSN